MRLLQRRTLIVLGLIAVAFVVVTLVCRPRPILVEAARVERGDVEDAVSNSQAGTVEARRRSRLGAERAGRVIAIPHREGERVARGEVLVLLDTSTAETSLELARRDLDVQIASQASARAGFELARAQHERSEALFRQRLIAPGDMDQARTQLDEARGALAAAEAAIGRARANVRLAQDDLAHRRVVAPFGGVVADRLVEVGESVVPGQAVIEIVSLDDLYVSAAIDEIDIGRLRDGLPARITLDPYRGKQWHGRVSRVFPTVDDRLEQNRTLTVEVDLAADSTLPTPPPGTSADVVIVLDTRHDILRVPTFAVIEGRRVWVIAGGRAVSRDVETGLRNWDWTEIRKGLEPGDVVITSVDKAGVRQGARVTPRFSSTPASQASSPREAGVRGSP